MMTNILATAATLTAVCTAATSAEPSPAEAIQIIHSDSRPPLVGPAQWFTGAVAIDMLVQPQMPARTSAATVRFEPGARTAWHRHPLGQSLIVTSGNGWVQEWGGPTRALQPGDVVWIPPGIKHWHGASASSALVHIAVQEALAGVYAEWHEQVSDEQYPR